MDNLDAAVSLHIMYDNLARVRETLETTPAMAAGLTDHVSTLEEITSRQD